MMLNEAATVHLVKGVVCANGVETRTFGDVQREILSSLSRLVAAEFVPHFMGGELRLFDTKGCNYSTVGRRVVVTYEEQDCDGFFHQVEYIGRVVDVDPFDGLLVKFEVADASGDVLWVGDLDEWAWAV